MVYGLVCASVFFASSQLRRSRAAAWRVSASRLALLFLTLQFIPCLLSLAKLIDQEFGCVCGVLQVEPGVMLELPNQKTFFSLNRSPMVVF
jgi:hypothetical protein